MRIIVYLFILLLLCCNENNESELYVKNLCDFGDVEECTDGPSEGECRRGTKFCWGNYWGDCEGEILPKQEVCDDLDNDCDGSVDNGVLNPCGFCGETPDEVCDESDNDCDGEIDEGFSGLDELCDGEDNDCDGLFDEGLSKRRECVPSGADGSWIIFDTDQNSSSTCRRGWQECKEGRWYGITQECEDFVGPQQEICDGLDNDCDGHIDDVDGLGECGVSDAGTCMYGQEYCVESEIMCIGSVNPQNESCDGLDNDCDGEVDEDLQRECETSCESGIETCSEGSWGGCTARSPTQEICDGEDNDCDRQIDEDLICDCNYGDVQPCISMPCGWGVKTCLENGTWSECVGQIPQPELCNAHDDNCNELVDEELVSECYDGEEETINVGICQTGQTTCNMGEWSECIGQQTPEDERCDGVDNNCDGLIDNMERLFERVDMVFAIDFSGSMDTYIGPLIEGIETYINSLQNSEHRFGVVSFGQTENSGDPYLHTQLTTIDLFIDSIRNTFTEGSFEPSLDALMQISSPDNPLGISWRSDSTPIVILITDEVAQTNTGLFYEDMFENTHVCRLPGCNSQTNQSWVDGDPLEIFAFLSSGMFSPWNRIIVADGVRIFNIARIQEEGTLSADLELLFTDICIDP